MTEAMQLLQEYGGWAATVFVTAALVWLYRDFRETIQAKDKTIEEISNARHSEIVAVVRECTAALTSVGEAIEECKRRRE